MSETHDKFCYNQHYNKTECNCRIIEMVRDDERARIAEENVESIIEWFE